MGSLKNKLKSITTEKVLESISEEDLFINAFCEMDVDSLVDLLDEGLDYGDINKWVFIESIRNKMEFFKLRKDTGFIQAESRCTGCNFGLNVLTFSGNYSGVQWAVRLEVDEREITSVYECGLFKEIC